MLPGARGLGRRVGGDMNPENHNRIVDPKPEWWERHKLTFACYMETNCVGKARAQTRDQVLEGLARQGVSLVWRTLCEMKQELIDEGTCPIGNCDKGYFVADTIDEMMEVYGREMGRADTVRRGAIAFKRCFFTRKRRLQGLPAEQAGFDEAQ